MIDNRYVPTTEFPRLELVSHHLCPYVRGR